MLDMIPLTFCQWDFDIITTRKCVQDEFFQDDADDNIDILGDDP